MRNLFPFMICLLIPVISQSLIQGTVSSTTFTFLNNCDETIYPVISSNPGIAPLQPTGFALQKGESKVLTAPSSSWCGRFWGRTSCSQDFDGNFTCASGDCGSGKLDCDSVVAAMPPATVAEFSLGGMDRFQVNLVDGFNLPLQVSTTGGFGLNCASAGCLVDLNAKCPSELRVMNSGGETVACKPSSYSQLFKTSCPQASSYAYDDETNTFNCPGGVDYHVNFCPPSIPSKKSKKKPQAPTTPRFNTGTINKGKDANKHGPKHMIGLSPPGILAVGSVCLVVVVVVGGLGVVYFVYKIKFRNDNACNEWCNCCIFYKYNI